MKPSSCFLLFLIGWGSCIAQLPQQYLFHHLTNRGQGKSLSQTSNHFIYKDSQGFVWISSIAGLNRFDGKNVKIYEEIIGDSTALHGQFVQGEFIEDEQNNIWFTTYRTLHKYERKKDNFRHFNLKDSLGSPIPGFYNCGMDSNKRLWLIHQDSLYLFDIKQQKFSVQHYLYPNALRGKIQKDTNGNVSNFYAYTPGESDLWILSNPLSQSAIPIHYLSENTESITTIHPELDSLIWIATDRGLARFNPFTKDYKLFNHLKRDTIGALLGMAPYGQEHLAISSAKKGFLFFNKNTLTFEQQVNYSTAYSSSFSSGGPVHVSRDSSIWLSIEGKGVDYTYPYEIKFNNHLTFGEGGYQGQQISFNKILEIGNGNIWGATFSHGIFIFNEAKQVLRRITSATHPELQSDLIIHLFKDDQNRIWILTWGGLSLYHLDTDTLEAINKDHIFLYGYQCRDGGILLCSYSRDGIWAINKDFHLQRVDQTGDAKFTFLYEDQEQRLYACKDLNSLFLFRQDTLLEFREALPLKGDFKAAYEEDLLIWFATTNGLIKLHKTNHDFEVFSRKDGLPSSTIYAILPDSKNNFWLSTNAGITCFDPHNIECQNYGLMEGISALEFNTFSSLRRNNNEIWLGSTDGLTTFYPEHIYSSTPPSVQITEILINDEFWPGLKCQQTLATNPSEIKEIKLPHTQNTLSFSFAALEYAHPENVRLQYQMEAIDNDWIKVKQDGFIRYSKLPPGSYTFRVKAATSIGAWSKPKSIRIIIQAPFYKTWWFILLSIFNSQLILALFLYSRQKRKKKLQQVLENQRNKFAQDMHDELGSSISSLKLSVEYIRKNASR